MGKGCSPLLLVGLSEAKGRFRITRVTGLSVFSSQPAEQRFLIKGCQGYRTRPGLWWCPWKSISCSLAAELPLKSLLSRTHVRCSEFCSPVLPLVGTRRLLAHRAAPRLLFPAGLQPSTGEARVSFHILFLRAGLCIWPFTRVRAAGGGRGRRRLSFCLWHHGRTQPATLLPQQLIPPGCGGDRVRPRGCGGLRAGTHAL